jgi:hypothetical protein
MMTRRLRWAPLLLAVGFEVGCTNNVPANADLASVAVDAPPVATAPAASAAPPAASPTAPAPITDTAKSPLVHSPFDAKANAPSNPDAPPAPFGPVTHWAHAFGGSGTDSITALVADATGNTYVTGYFEGQIDLGCGSLDAGGNFDMFVAKLTPEGACAWSAQGGSSYWMSGTALAVDADGALYLAGQFRGSAQFGADTLWSQAWTDGFVARFDAAGVKTWVRSVGGAADDLPNVIQVYDGEIVLAGGFFGAGNFGGADLISTGDEDAFAAGYDAATGAYRWQKQFGGVGGDAINAIALGAGGQVFVAGHFESSIQIGETLLESDGLRDAFFAALPAEGHASYARRFGGLGDDSITSAALDAHGNIVLAGTFQQSMSIGELVAVGDQSGFIAKFDGQGMPLWSAALAATSYASALGIALDESGNAFVSGTFAGAPAAGFGVQGSTPPAPTNDAFVVRYSAEGLLAWSKLMTSGSNIAARALTIAGSDLIVGGAFDGAVSGETSLTSFASTDALVLAISR